MEKALKSERLGTQYRPGNQGQMQKVWIKRRPANRRNRPAGKELRNPAIV
jgi:hypothetical protein